MIMDENDLNTDIQLENEKDVLCPDVNYPVASTDIIKSKKPPLKIGATNPLIPTNFESIKDEHLKSVRAGNWQLSEPQITAISGALAGFVSGIIVCPLDVVKTRLQAQGLQYAAENKYYHGLVGTVSTIVRDEGFKGLYKGLAPITMGYLPSWMIYFSTYEFCKDTYRQIFVTSEFISHSCAAITAGAVSTIITNPIWVIKTRLMLQTDITTDSTHYRGTLDAFKKIYIHEGMRAFYAGLVPSFFGLLHVAVQFPLFERFKVLFKTKVKRKMTKEERDNNPNDSTGYLYELNLSKLIMASCISKMIASVISYPHEILRTRMQLKSDLPAHVQHKIIPLIKTTYMKEGLYGFYSGFFINLLRTVPASSFALISFEYVRNYLENSDFGQNN